MLSVVSLAFCFDTHISPPPPPPRINPVADRSIRKALRIKLIGGEILYVIKTKLVSHPSQNNNDKKVKHAVFLHAFIFHVQSYFGTWGLSLALGAELALGLFY